MWGGGDGGGREGRQRILHMCRNLRGFSSDLMPFLQKRIIFADFCFESIGIAEITAVLQEFPLTEEMSQGKTVISQFFWKVEL
jgi:hypothetical protein